MNTCLSTLSSSLPSILYRPLAPDGLNDAEPWSGGPPVPPLSAIPLTSLAAAVLTILALKLRYSRVLFGNMVVYD